MSTPIKPEDVRAGDTIRVEFDDSSDLALSAIEYVSKHDGPRYESGHHSLLDRPTPAVELPTEPTLGRLTRSDGEEGVGLFSAYENAHGEHRPAVKEFDSFGRYARVHTNVRAFTPLRTLADDEIAVPKWELGNLQDAAADGTVNLTAAALLLLRATESGASDD